MASSVEKEKSVLRKIPPSIISFMLGVGIGIAVESHTDAIAEKKVITAETCEQIHPQPATITKSFIDCVDKGVPGGTHIDPSHFTVGDSAAYIDTYIEAQKNEAGIELDRVILWGIGGAAIGLADYVL